MKPLKSTLPLVSGLVFFTACSDPIGPSEALTELPRALTLAESATIEASNAFSFDLLRRVAEDPQLGAGNTFLSPFSVSMALGMTMNGANGGTFDAMRSVFGFEGMDQQAINEAYRGLLDLLLDLDDRVEISSAQSVWSREGFPFNPPFFQALRDYFDAEARTLDFSLPSTKDVINSWVRDQTNGRIDDIVQQVNPDDVLFILNAVYFKALWTKQFLESETRLVDFHLEGAAGPVQVEAMNGRINIGMYQDLERGVEVAEIPYGGQAFTMVVAMPPRGGSVDALVASLDASTWADWMSRIRYSEVPVQLPKTTLEYEARLDGPLKAMGMGVAFSQSEADFSRMTPAQVFISRVRHKTFLSVDEEGTEAAAATSVGVTVTSAPAGLYVDRPYVLAIRERLSGTILFMGVVRDPR